MSERRSRHRRGSLLVLGAVGDPDPSGHNYAKRLAQLWRSGRLPAMPGTVSTVRIYHDDWCPKLRGGLCSCQPDLELATTPEASA